MRLGIVTKLWLTITALTMGVLIILGTMAARQMEGLYDFHLSEHMVGSARGLVELYDPAPGSTGERPWERLEPVLGADVTLLPAARLAALAGGEPVPAEVPPALAQRLQAGEAVTWRRRAAAGPPPAGAHSHGGEMPGQGREEFVAAVPLVRGGQPDGALLLSTPVRPLLAAVNRFRLLLAGTAAAVLAAVTHLALVLSRRLSRPLLEMDSMALAMAAGDFRRRVAVRGQDEVGRLGQSINRLAGALAATIRQLAENHSRLAGILSSMSDGVIAADATGHTTLMNPPAMALANAAELPCGCATATADWACLEQLGIGPAVRQVLADARPRLERIRLGNSVFAVHLTPLHDDGGAVQGAVAVWQDVTQAERLEEMRRDFVANVSHEMRTPISLVQGYVEALQDGLHGSPAEQAQILGIIREEMERLQLLVTDLLQVARLDAGQERMEPEGVALAPLVAYTVRRLARPAAETGVGIDAELAPDLPPVWADPDRLEQVLVNLLDNALRHSPPGSSVTVATAVAGGQMTVRVRDRGPGIPPAERHLVWERFYRGSQARCRRRGGTGLGLAIVRGIVAAHGGRVWVEAAAGRGSCFCFTLPLAGAGPAGA